jgi:hypothetical protein
VETVMVPVLLTSAKNTTLVLLLMVRLPLLMNTPVCITRPAPVACQLPMFSTSELELMKKVPDVHWSEPELMRWHPMRLTAVVRLMNAVVPLSCAWATATAPLLHTKLPVLTSRPVPLTWVPAPMSCAEPWVVTLPPMLRRPVDEMVMRAVTVSSAQLLTTTTPPKSSTTEME